MDDRQPTPSPADAPDTPANGANKYAEVLHEAAAIKRTRTNLDDERFYRQRPSVPPAGYSND
ncbi:MAG TPA: hypothetical protein V6D47_08625 [Oscillatoriaceae cyanobacterium]